MDTPNQNHVCNSAFQFEESVTVESLFEVLKTGEFHLHSKHNQTSLL